MRTKAGLVASSSARQYLYFCTSKAGKFCAFVLVTQYLMASGARKSNTKRAIKICVGI
jgi:hypothetical protein